MPVTQIDLEAERLRRSLRLFVEAAWPLIEPAPFVPGAHIDLVCHYLQLVAAGKLRRLLINIPPRHGKSLLISVFFPAWLWASQPQRRWLCASYASSLALRDSSRCRRLIESPWYQERWPHVRLATDTNSKERFELTAGGARITTGVGGAATGEGGDIIIVDDPHKIEEATSANQRENTLQWYDAVMATRHNNPREGATVIVGQRLHEHDLFGHLLARGGFEHLCLPAEFEHSHPYRHSLDARTQEREPLWPQQFTVAELKELRDALGSRNAAGQLQQRPGPAEGAIFQRHWWRWYQPEQLPQFDRLIQSWDLAYSADGGADYTVGQIWGASGANKYLLHQLRARLTFTEQCAAVGNLTGWINSRFPDQHGHAIIVEHAANADALIDQLQRTIPSIIPVRPHGGKIFRADAVTPQVQAGNVYLRGAPNADNSGCDRTVTPTWVQALVDEAQTFPSGTYDDQVDAMSQALTYLVQPEPRVLTFRSRRPRR